MHRFVDFEPGGLDTYAEAEYSQLIVIAELDNAFQVNLAA
jgi:hypothetical protein